MFNKMSNESSLLARIAAPDNLARAWRKVRSNIAVARRATSCGVDEVSVAAFEQQWEANLAELGAALLERRYRPLPVRRVTIARPGGKQRTIGVLAVRDRIAQRAAQQVLEPIFEAEFLDCSYGFRPGRSAADAVHRVLCYRQAGCTWAFDADVAHCFDALDHRLLMRFAGETVREDAVLDLIHAWLEAGLLEADAPVYQAGGFWDRVVERVAGMVMGQGYRPSGVPPGEFAAGEEGLDGWDDPWPGEDDWPRQALWRRIRSDTLMLGLTAARPLARRAGGALRWLARRKGAALGMAGLAGAAALGGAWWTLQRLSPRGAGALQGGALSPLLANAYLHRFDLAMVARERNLVRYADDLVVCCCSEAEAREAAEEAALALADLRLRLNPDKTRVVSFEQGFSFLGRRFQGEGLAPSTGRRVRQAVQRGRDRWRKRGRNREHDK